MEDNHFITIQLKTEDGELYRVPILRAADEIEIYFYPRNIEPRRDVFCLTTKQVRKGRPHDFACFGSRCAICGNPYIRCDSTGTCDDCLV